MILLQKGTVYSPNYLGKKDILIGGREILAIEDKIDLPQNWPNLEIIDVSNSIICPGFIDSHVHICGGGGEGGFKTRTPEITLSSIVEAGITTVVGTLGTDGTTRTMENLLAKAYALEEEGISTFTYTGSYRYPVLSLTESIRRDIILIEKIIGAGEIALSDHRGSQIGWKELAKIASDTRAAGILSRKAGIVNVHLGDGAKGLKPILECIEQTEIPITQFYPTHVNRNTALLKQGIDYAKQGGFIDFTTSSSSHDSQGSGISASEALHQALREGVKISQITFTTDAQGSLPSFDESGNFVGLEVGKPKTLLESFQDAVLTYSIPIEKALRCVTENPANILHLHDKGILGKGKAADLTILNKRSLSLETLIAKGQALMLNGEILKYGTFE